MRKEECELIAQATTSIARMTIHYCDYAAGRNISNLLHLLLARGLHMGVLQWRIGKLRRGYRPGKRLRMLERA